MFKRREADEFSFDDYERHSNSTPFIAMIFVLLLAAGAALDYARVANMREGIDAAVKSASEAGQNAMRDGTPEDAAIKTVVLSHFNKAAVSARHVGTIDTPAVHIDRAAATVTVNAKGTVAMTAGRLIGLDEVEVPATFTATSAPRDADDL